MIEELPHVPELFVARFEQISDRLVRQHHQLPVQHDVEQTRRPFIIGVRPGFRLGHDLVNNAQLFQVRGGNLQRNRRRFRLRGVTPHDGRAAFRRNYGVNAVFQNVHAVAHGYGQCAARSALAGHGHNNGHRQARHFAQVERDRFGLSAFLSVQARVGPLRIDERKNRPAILRGQLHHTQRFAIALWFWLTEISHEPLFGIAALLMANNRHRPPVKFPKACDDRLVVAVSAVSVQFHKIGEQQADKIQRIWPLWMPRDLRALPRTEMLIKFAPQLGHLLANPFYLGVAVGASGKMAHLLDVFLQAVDLALAASLGRNFFSGCHHITNSMACAPQMCRTDSTSSALTVTRCCACSTATEPSGECSSKRTGLGPGEPPNNSASRSSVPSLSDSISSRTRNSRGAFRSPISSSRRASCSESRVPASSTCTRAVNNNGVPGFSIFSSFAKLSGKAKSSCTPVISCSV